MGSHPVNLAIRFFLELMALVAMGFWGWRQGGSMTRYVLAALVPLAAAALWGIFAVPGDPSRSGSALVAVPGALRLGLEAAFFAFAVWALYRLGNISLARTMAAALAVHYAVSYDRLAWLLRS
jgi:Protein of unknown function (DUF2568)